ncbi:MAG: hypothetical protein KIT08_05440 [Anaerolineales bacterium]|nr:MAG: hypothetical protein KIT08_05440 [Anaerolineales bacterium]
MTPVEIRALTTMIGNIPKKQNLETSDTAKIEGKYTQRHQIDRPESEHAYKKNAQPAFLAEHPKQSGADQAIGKSHHPQAAL